MENTMEKFKCAEQKKNEIVAYIGKNLLEHSITPLPVFKLGLGTNLNVPPLDAWEDSHYSSANKWRTYSRAKDCFESFHLANKYVDAVGNVDIITTAETLKKLVSTAFSKQQINLVVHKIGKTLLIDDCAYMKKHCYSHPQDTKPLVDFLDSKSLSRVGVPQSSRVNVGTFEMINEIADKMITENLYIRSVGRLSVIKRNTEHGGGPCGAQTGNKNVIDGNDENGLADPLENYSFACLQIDDEIDLDESYGHLWKFYDLNILVDVSLPIFGCKTNPCVTLLPKDLKHRPINFLTGVDLYLDQSMCNAPEALLCWHMGGFVKEYEVIRTEDIPRLEHSKFDPASLRIVAENIVSFLQEKAAVEGHTYWLCHDKAEDDRESMLRLWDLTPLCGELLEDRSANPFTLSVAILMYKVARNLMRRSALKRPRRVANAAFRLLNVALGIIDKEKHSQVAACIHYLLANLYLSYGYDTLGVNPKDEEDMERSEPTWAYDDRWQLEYGETYETYAQISIESLKKKRFQDGKRDKPAKVRTLPSCTTTADCCKEALEHCLEGLRYMALFEENESKEQRVTNPLSFINEHASHIDRGREEADAMLKVDVRSILLIRAASAYRTLANSSFLLARHGRSLRFARVGLYCCLAVIRLNGKAETETSRRNLTTARALLPAMMCHIAESLGNIACASAAEKDSAKDDLQRCYRDKQIKRFAVSYLANRTDILRDVVSDSDEADANSNCSNCSFIESIGLVSDVNSISPLGELIKENSYTRSCAEGYLKDDEQSGKTQPGSNNRKRMCRHKVLPFKWAFPRKLHLPFKELIAIAERSANVAMHLGRKIAPLSLFPPTSAAIMFKYELARRLGNLRNVIGRRYIRQLRNYFERISKETDFDQEALMMYAKMDLGVLTKLSRETDISKMLSQVVQDGKRIFTDGVKLFASADDFLNETLLLSNIGQLDLLRYHALVQLTKHGQPYRPKEEGDIVNEAIGYFQKALDRVRDHDTAKVPWFESVSNNLAVTYYWYAVRVQDRDLNEVDCSNKIRELLNRALSAFLLIRNTPTMSLEMRRGANEYIVDIHYRFAKTYENTTQSTNARKAKESIREADRWFISCVNYAKYMIKEDNLECVTLRTCFIALHALVQISSFAAFVPQGASTASKLKVFIRAAKNIFEEAYCFTNYIKRLKAKENIDPKSSVDHLFFSKILMHFFQRCSVLLRDTVICAKHAKLEEREFLKWKQLFEYVLHVDIKTCTPSELTENLCECADRFHDLLLCSPTQLCTVCAVSSGKC